jgi:hypothetical protein
VLADAAAEAARSAASRPDPARPGALARLLERALARAAGPRLAGAMLLLALLGGLGAGYATAPGPSAAELALLGAEDEDTLALAAFGAAEPF